MQQFRRSGDGQQFELIVVENDGWAKARQVLFLRECRSRHLSPPSSVKRVKTPNAISPTARHTASVSPTH